MNTAEIRGKIHDYIDRADERMLRIIHSIVEGDSVEEPKVPDWHYKEVERRMQAHLSEDGKTCSWEEAKARIQNAISN